MILIGSTRPGRLALPIGEWVADRARAHGAFDVEIADLAEIGLPLMDEPDHPRMRQYTKPHTRAWSERVDAADAFVFVSPEYNYGIAAPLKNAIDYLHDEWKHKAVGFVSYGGVSAGTRAVQMTKQIISALSMVPVYDAVNIPFVFQFLDDESRVQANDAMEDAATQMFDALLEWDTALRPMREQQAQLAT